jgi:small subunit ribosomal protein S20
MIRVDEQEALVYDTSTMANTSAAKKYIRISGRKRSRNVAWYSKFRTLRTSFNRSIESNNTDEAKDAAHKLQSNIDRMSRRNILHPNAAARMKSRIAARLKKGSTK